MEIECVGKIPTDIDGNVDEGIVICVFSFRFLLFISSLFLSVFDFIST